MSFAAYVAAFAGPVAPFLFRRRDLHVAVDIRRLATSYHVTGESRERQALPLGSFYLATSYHVTGEGRERQALPLGSFHLVKQPQSVRPASGLSSAQPGSKSKEVVPFQGRRNFHATALHRRDHHFDTLKFVQRLKGEGFSEEQAVAMMKVLSDVIEESIQNLTRTMVPREDQEKASYTQKVDFAKLRSELLSSDSTESALTRASHERLTNELSKLSSRLRDEISRTQASVRLDLNLEKGRIREEANVQELKVKETETRIEQEVAGLRERVEGVKFSTLQWLMGVCTGTAAIILGAWRLLM